MRYVDATAFHLEIPCQNHQIQFLLSEAALGQRSSETPSMFQKDTIGLRILTEILCMLA